MNCTCCKQVSDKNLSDTFGLVPKLYQALHCFYETFRCGFSLHKKVVEVSKLGYSIIKMGKNVKQKSVEYL
jgi:hypothetical protein